MSFRARRFLQNKKRLIIPVILILVVGAILIINFKPNKNTVATVNGEEITSEELEKRFELISSENPIATKKDVLDQLIRYKLLAQEAEKNNININDKEVEDSINQIETSSGQSIEDLLKLSKMSYEELKKKITEQLTINALLSDVFKNLMINDDEVENFYSRSKELFITKPSVDVSYIALNTIEESNEVKNLLDQGEDFEKLAVERSIDPSAKLNKGNIGVIAKGQTLKSFEDVAFGLKEGEISDPVDTGEGFSIIRLNKILQPRQLDLAEIKEFLRKSLLEEKQKIEAEKYITSLLAKAKIKINQ